MKTNYTIADATLDDLEGIVNIYNSTIAGRMVTADLDPASVESKRQWFDEHSPDHRPLWVIKREGEVVAWLSFQSFYGRPAYQSTAEISIYISENYRSTGLGSLLIEKAIIESPSLQIHTLLGFVFAHNHPSLAFLKKHDFEEWGYLPRVAILDEIERDLVIVGRRIFR